MSGYFVKNPDSELELLIDWRAGYLQRNEKVSGDLGWTIRLVEDVPGELKIAYQECTATTSKAVFTNGIPGQIYMVSSKIRTTQERVLERTLVFRVSQRNFI